MEEAIGSYRAHTPSPPTKKRLSKSFQPSTFFYPSPFLLQFRLDLLRANTEDKREKKQGPFQKKIRQSQELFGADLQKISSSTRKQLSADPRKLFCVCAGRKREPKRRKESFPSSPPTPSVLSSAVKNSQERLSPESRKSVQTDIKNSINSR